MRLLQLFLCLAWTSSSFQLETLVQSDSIQNGATSTIIDVLSGSAQFSTLLDYIRHHGLVPIINEATDITLFAPVNTAFYGIDSTRITTDVLLYHMLNESITIDKSTPQQKLAKSWLASPGYRKPDKGMPLLIRASGDSVVVNHRSEVVDANLPASPKRGIVHAVDKLLFPPDKICEVIGGFNDTCKFSSLLTMEYDCQLEKLPHFTTGFIPSDSAFDLYNEVELSYLLSGAPDSSLDRNLLIDAHFALAPVLSGTEQNFTTADGTEYSALSDLSVGSVPAPLRSDILANNGALHIYSKFLRDDIVTFNPEKYLHGLGAEQFISEVRFRNLEYLLNGSFTEPQTVFVPSSSDSNLHVSSSAQGLLLYHFVQGQYSFSEHVGEKLLVYSQMSTGKLGDYYQRLKVAVSSSGSVYVNGHKVISDEYQVGNTSIYILNSDLVAPPPLESAVGPFFQSSYSLGFLETLNLLQPPKGNPWTYLLPSRKAWEEQDLVLLYLRRNTTALHVVFDSLIFDSPMYTDNEEETVKFLSGEKAEVSFSEDQSKICVGDMTYEIDAPNILFDSGVAHSVDSFPVPQSVDISARNLISVGGRSDYIDLLDARNYSHVLDSLDDAYTILVPNPETLEKDDISLESENIDQVLGLHILPGNPMESLVKGYAVPTLVQDVSLLARNISGKLYFLHVINGEQQEAFVVQQGDTTQNRTVLFLDKYISPDWVYKPILPPPFRLKTHVAVLLGVAGGVLIMFLIIVALFYSIMKAPAKDRPEPEWDEDETSALLDGAESPASSTESDIGNSRRYGATSPTGEQGTAPIATSRVQEQRQFGQHLDLP